MRVFRCNPVTFDRPIALTIGNFDGVHLGHREILRRLVSEAATRDMISAVMIFDPQPAEFFNKEIAPVRVFSTREKVLAIAECGVDVVIRMRFDAKFYLTAADDFVRQTLADRLNVGWLLVGDDFRFGAGRKGDFELLKRVGTELGFLVEAHGTVSHNGYRVSSTAVREALVNGDLVLAESLLGKGYNINGRVVRGDQLGRELGFPTANINLSRPTFPLRGIFIAMVSGISEFERPALVSIGVRPTVTNHGDLKVEVYVLDFDGNLYGKRLGVRFLSKLRDELKFDNESELISAMKKDEAAARLFFQNQLQVDDLRS